MTPRDLRRAGLVHDPAGWGIVLLAALTCWRGTPQGVRLPAMSHELRHLLTQDPRAGH